MIYNNHRACEIDFSFDKDVTLKDIQRIQKKVTTVISKMDYVIVASIFTNRHNIRITLTFEVEKGDNVYKELSAPLTRLINTHKQPASFGWALNSFTNKGE